MVNGDYPQTATMRISAKAQELAKLKYIRQVQVLSSTHWANIRHHEQFMPRDCARHSAIDKEHVMMLRAAAELYGQTLLESFIAEGIWPNKDDFKEIQAEMERIVNHRSDGSRWTPLPATNASLTHLAQSVLIDLANQVRQMELEDTLKKPASTSYSVNVQGDVHGGVQVGPNNTQNIGADDET